jgi:hypothetical protein
MDENFKFSSKYLQTNMLANYMYAEIFCHFQSKFNTFCFAFITIFFSNKNEGLVTTLQL